MTLPQPTAEKEYPAGKHEEELNTIPVESKGYRYRLSRKGLTEGLYCTVKIHLMVDNEIYFTRTFTMAGGSAIGRDGVEDSETWVEGEFPYLGQRQLVPTSIKVEMDVHKEFTSETKLEAINQLTRNGINR